MNTSLRLFLVPVLLSLGLVACVDDEFDTPPIGGEDLNITVTTRITDLKGNYAGGDAVLIDDLFPTLDSIVISGIVNADDATGNFFKELTFQDQTGGILIRLDRADLVDDFPVGKRVYIYLNGLYLGDFNGLVQIGAQDETDPASVARLPDPLIDRHVIGGSSDNAIDPVVTTIPGLTNELQNMLVTIEDVEFADGLAGIETYATFQTTENRDLVDCMGNTMVLRTSGFSTFFADTLPAGNGSITGIYSVFGTTDQLRIDDTDQVALDSARCDGSGGGGGNQLLANDFSSYAMGDFVTTPPSGWLNYAETGSVEWEFGSHNSSADQYAKASAFGSSEQNTIWLVSPAIDMDATTNETLSFRVAGGFFDAASLECMVSTDYDGDGTPEDATWTALPVTLPTGGSNFVWQDGLADHDMSSYTGTIYIAWRYIGDDPAGETMTWEIDEIELVGE